MNSIIEIDSKMPLKEMTADFSYIINVQIINLKKYQKSLSSTSQFQHQK